MMAQNHTATLFYYEPGLAYSVQVCDIQKTLKMTGLICQTRGIGRVRGYFPSSYDTRQHRDRADVSTSGTNLLDEHVGSNYVWLPFDTGGLSCISSYRYR